MTTTPYQQGRAKEYRIKTALERGGWTVYRTAGSHSQWDLLAVRPEGWLLVQCKVGSVSRPFLQRLGDWCRDHLPSGTVAEVWTSEGKYRVWPERTP